LVDPTKQKKYWKCSHIIARTDLNGDGKESVYGEEELTENYILYLLHPRRVTE